MGGLEPRGANEMRRYLLGQLAEADEERIERQLLGDPHVLGMLEEAEDDLIEDYLDGVLSPEERTGFEQRFLASPEHRQSLESARLVRAHFVAVGGTPASSSRTTISRTWWIIPLAASVTIAVGILVRPRPETKTAGDVPSAPASSVPPAPSPPGTEAPPRPETAPGEQARRVRPAPARETRPVKVARLTLLPHRTMAGEDDVETLRIEHGQTRIQIEILVEGPEAYRELSADLACEEGPSTQWTKLKPAAVVVLALPSSRLEAGRCTLALDGVLESDSAPEEVGRWSLVVEKA